jgi:hypothetical protein
MNSAGDESLMGWEEGEFCFYEDGDMLSCSLILKANIALKNLRRIYGYVLFQNLL